MRNTNLQEQLDTRFIAENKSLQGTTNILNADNQLLTTKEAELSNRHGMPKRQDQASDFQEVTSQKKTKKPTGSKHTQWQHMSVTVTDQGQVAPQCNDTTDRSID